MCSALNCSQDEQCCQIIDLSFYSFIYNLFIYLFVYLSLISHF